jgi:hypothetical protein
VVSICVFALIFSVSPRLRVKSLRLCVKTLKICTIILIVGFWDQRNFDVRFEWCLQGLEALSECRTFIIVDILSFTTCVSIALARKATDFPYRWKGQTAHTFAQEHHDILAVMRDVKGSH